MTTPIIAPIKPGDTGGSVANLQGALSALLSHNLIKSLDAPNRPTAAELKKLSEALKAERAQSLFGDTTRRLLVYLQVQQGLGDSLRGAVEEKTAAKLNDLFKSIGSPDSDSALVVRGTLSYPDQSPAAGMTVSAFDRDVGSENSLGEATTDSSGAFQITYRDPQFRRSPKESRGADVFVRVRGAAGEILLQSKTVINAPADLRLDLVLPAGSLVVQGRITGAQPGQIVTAFDQDMRSAEKLGAAPVDLDGRYEIRYTASQFKRAEKGSADLRIEVTIADGSTQSSPIYFNAPADQTIDLTLTGSSVPSEYERHLADLAPVLDGVALTDLDEKDVVFLIGDTGISRDYLGSLVASARISLQTAPSDTRVGPNVSAAAIPAAAFYGWFRLGLPVDWTLLQARPVTELRKVLLKAIAQNLVPVSLRDSLETILARVPNANSTGLRTLLTGIALAPEKISLVLTQADGIDTVSDRLLAQLVAQKNLDPTEAGQIGLNVSAHRLTGGNQPLVASLLKTKLPSGRTLQNAGDLAALEPADWARALQTANSPLPTGFSLPTYARSLALAAVNDFPHAAFVQRVTAVPDTLTAQLQKIQPLLAKNPQAFTVDFGSLDLTEIPETNRASMQDAYEALHAFVQLHPGLDLPSAFAQKNGADGAAKLVTERIGWLGSVFQENPTVDFLHLDYLPDSPELKAVKLTTVPDTGRAPLLRELRSHQRMFAVTSNPIASRELMHAGYASASAIALRRVNDFIADTGLNGDEGRRYHAKASDQVEVAATDWHRLYTAARDQATTAISVIPSHNQFFKPLTGFQDLISNQTWCDCAHCQSVLSPAAYFVDLMNYIEKNILLDSFKGREKHPLHLKIRRGDLWTLPLTCANTETYVPTLDLVIEVLEAYLKLAVPASASNLYQYLAGQTGSFQQPFTRPIERLEILLGHFQLSRAAIARTMGSTADIRTRTRLKLSVTEYELITTAKNAPGDLAFQQQLFKFPAMTGLTSADSLFGPVETRTLTNATGLSRDLLKAVLLSSYVSALGPVASPIALVLGKRDPNDVQNNSDLTTNLTINRLDRVDRFIRLWRKLPWSVAELDYFLKRRFALNVSTDVDGPTLQQLADCLDLNEDWSLPIDELFALADIIPIVALRDPVSLFDRLFNEAPFAARDGAWPPAIVFRFTHPGWSTQPAGVSSPDKNTLLRLVAGLQLGDQDLVALINGLSSVPTLGHKPADLTAMPPTDESILISTDSLAVLYRHARLTRLLGLSVADFILLLRLALRPIAGPIDPARALESLADARAVADYLTWQKSSGFSLSEINYLTGGEPPDGATSPTDLTTQIVSVVQSAKSLEFADTIFTQLGLTDIASRQIVADNQSADPQAAVAFIATGDGNGYRLLDKFDPTTSALVLNVPPGAPALDPAPFRQLLQKYSAGRVLDIAAGSALALALDDVTALRQLAHPLDAADQAKLAAELRGDAPVVLTAVLTDLLRYRLLLRSPAFLLTDTAGTTGFAYVLSKAKLFEFTVDANGRPAGGGAVSTQVVRNVAAYSALASATDTGFSTASGPTDLDALRSVLQSPATAKDADLATALRTEPACIGALKPHLLSLPSNPFDALALMQRCLVLTVQLGVSGETLNLIVAEVQTAGVFDPTATFAGLDRAAEDIYGAFRSKYPDQASFQAKMDPFEDQLRSITRDGLVDFIVNRWPDPFSDSGKLYEYFLIDVQMEGCGRTSRVVSAISSLQLYVHRVLMNLELSADWDRKIPPVVGVYAHFSDPDKRDEWYFREHYRIWEANRRVFLYPENYLEPELRDDKTPLFQDLESILLQLEITDLNASDAYAKYLTGFDELARLKVAGIYSDQDNHTLHLFGVTSDSPPAYYYRTIVELPGLPEVAFAWSKITVQIPVKKVSPLLFEGRLYVFWLETTTRPVTSFAGGTSEFGGYRHTIRTKYTTLRPDGIWTAPQTLKFSDGTSTVDSRIVSDPTIGQSQKDDIIARIKPEQDAVNQLTKDQSDAQTKLNTANADAATKKKTADDAALGPQAPSGEDIRIASEVAAASAAAFSLGIFAGPDFAAQQGLVAAFGVISLEIANAITGSPPSMRDLQLAGVTWVDLFHLIVLKYKAYEAKLIAQIYAQNLGMITNFLNLEQAKLDNLTEALAGARVLVRWDKSHRDHSEPLDDYHPEGWEWDRPYPDDYRPADTVESIHLTIVPSDDHATDVAPPERVDVTAGTMSDQSAAPSIALDGLVGVVQPDQSIGLAPGSDNHPDDQKFYSNSLELLNDYGNYSGITALAAAGSDLQAINGEPGAAVIESRGDALLFRVRASKIPFVATRLGTTVTADLKRSFGANGIVSDLLDATVQQQLTERPAPIVPYGGYFSVDMPSSPFDPANRFRTYFRETFFHIPFLVANHLNGDQQFAATQRWYHYIFNPLATDGNAWRYFEFAQLVPGTQSLRKLLTEKTAIAAYKANPLNPDAIARTRLSAYQKSIVMKYVDNLLDWGDSLFSEFTMESVAEAKMYYQLARDILGPRPAPLGPCGEDSSTPNYETIKANVLNGEINDFLIELEPPPTLIPGRSLADEKSKFVIDQLPVATAQPARGLPYQTRSFVMPLSGTPYGGPAGPGPITTSSSAPGGNYWTNVGGTSLSDLYGQRPVGTGPQTIQGAKPPLDFSNRNTGNIDFVPTIDTLPGGQYGVSEGTRVTSFDQTPPINVHYGARDIPLPGYQTRGPKTPTRTPVAVDLIPPKKAVFCIPANTDLLAYWDRVDDRFFKIDNCMDITGVKRQLDLFAPEINLKLLLRMKAAGLTLDDVLNSVAGNVPPYRFTHLIEKARQYAGTLQNLGAQLLAAFEKRDSEELTQLRAVHEQNLLTMRSRSAQLEIDAAEDTLSGLQRQLAAVQYRRDYYQGLSDAGLLGAERTQQQNQRQASEFRTLASLSQYIAAVLSIIPDLGAPTAMKFGGSQLGAAGRAVADGLGAVASFNEMAAAMAGIEASNQRRDQEWKHQVQLAKLELDQIQFQITAAGIRRDIAAQAMEVHLKSLDQAEEVFAFLRDKFSNFDRYNLIAKRLRELYRIAYNSALSMARMAEQAFRTELTDDVQLVGNYWDADNLGLLAGEALLADLQGLEQRYVETNYRQIEVEQSFSLALFDPDALTQLRLTGDCSFSVPEWFFDLTYPGQYRRRLRAVRLSIPCVTGPFINVGALLRMTGSRIRLEPLEHSTATPPPAAPAPTMVPLRHTVTIATSKAQYDSGVFDFSFRDERYMPFEWTGALSDWQLTLPGALRSFDYTSISDAVLHLSYTSDYDETHRSEVESGVNSALAQLTQRNAMTRVFSLRQDFPDVFYRLWSSPLDTEVLFSIEPRHFSYFLLNRTLKADLATLHFISPLSTLTSPGPTLAFRPKNPIPAAPNFRNFTPDLTAEFTSSAQTLRSFDCGTMLQSQPTNPAQPPLPSVIIPAIVGDYLIKFTAAGSLAPSPAGTGSGPLDPSRLHDITIEIGFSLV